MRNFDNFRQAAERPKSWNSRRGYLCPKSTCFQVKQCIEWIYLIFLSTTCVKIHQISYVIFETISHFSRHISSAFFLAQTLHTFDKRSPSERKFSDFPLLLMVLKLSISFSGPRVIFSWNFVSLFSVMRLFCTFLSKHLYAYDKRSPSNWKFSDFRLVARKLTEFLMSVFNPRVSFLLSFASPFSVMAHNSSNIFYPKY